MAITDLQARGGPSRATVLEVFPDFQVRVQTKTGEHTIPLSTAETAVVGDEVYIAIIPPDRREVAITVQAMSDKIPGFSCRERSQTAGDPP